MLVCIPIWPIHIPRTLFITFIFAPPYRIGWGKERKEANFYVTSLICTVVCWVIFYTIFYLLCENTGSKGFYQLVFLALDPLVLSSSESLITQQQMPTDWFFKVFGAELWQILGIWNCKLQRRKIEAQRIEKFAKLLILLLSLIEKVSKYLLD